MSVSSSKFKFLVDSQWYFQKNKSTSSFCKIKECVNPRRSPICAGVLIWEYQCGHLWSWPNITHEKTSETLIQSPPEHKYNLLHVNSHQLIRHSTHWPITVLHTYTSVVFSCDPDNPRSSCIIGDNAKWYKSPCRSLHSGHTIGATWANRANFTWPFYSGNTYFPGNWHANRFLHKSRYTDRIDTLLD
jgi:hypothetical protein